ncbi:hypothetical protein DXG03_002309 [Asterophora parasitica]|uniref:Uncharacterized protein n=1 Tax=Asterophora parasitica TaxID=117018 RepID=A0A9P7KCB5_9AGAR|nr:hypothetical protein DXG03_002309 [Asterophora parasitica]
MGNGTVWRTERGMAPVRRRWVGDSSLISPDAVSCGVLANSEEEGENTSTKSRHCDCETLKNPSVSHLKRSACSAEGDVKRRLADVPCRTPLFNIVQPGALAFPELFLISRNVECAMDEKSAPGTVVLAKGPIVVEESRAQRLQRQQARFRDRGGIFVPSNRNTLADILMGRKAASPKRVFGRARSSSLSPSKRGSGRMRSEGAPEPPQTLRASPRKAARKDVEEDGPVAGPSRLPELSASKATKKPSRKSTTAKSKTTSTTGTATTTTTTITAPKKGKAKATSDDDVDKAPAKRRGRPSKAKPITDDDDENTPKDDPPPKPKGKGKRSAKPSAKRATKKKAGLVDQAEEDDPQPAAPTHPNPKRAGAKRTKKDNEPPGGYILSLSEVGLADVVIKATETTSVTASNSKSKSKATAKASSVNTKAKQTMAAPEGALSTIPELIEVNSEGEIEDELVPPISVHDDKSTSKSNPKPAASTSTSTSGSVAPTTPSVVKVSRSKVLEEIEIKYAIFDERPASPPTRPAGRKGKAKATPLQFDEEEEEQVTQHRAAPSKRARAFDAAGGEERVTKRSKVALEPEMAEEEEEDPPLQMKPKAKPKIKAVNGGKDGRRKVKDKGELPSSRKKRERELGSAQDQVEDMDAPGRPKRAKIEAQDASEGEEDAPKKAAPAKRSTTKVSSSKSQTKSKSSSSSSSSKSNLKPAPKSGMSESKSKSSEKSRPHTDVYIKLKSSPDPESGKMRLKPRKSVMQRLREPLPQMEDDEPDPIDFLR